jgi:tetrahydromethanopterin S-methyltransferase subunit B
LPDRLRPEHEPVRALIRDRDRRDMGVAEAKASRMKAAPQERATAARHSRREGLLNATKRVFLVVLTALVSATLVIGGPLLALWVGSRIQTTVGLSMTAAGAVIGVLILETFLLYKALIHLNAAYNAAVDGTDPRRQLAWHKPMRGERRSVAATRPLSVVEGIVVGTAVAGVLACVVWFFFFAHA